MRNDLEADRICLGDVAVVRGYFVALPKKTVEIHALFSDLLEIPWGQL